MSRMDVVQVIQFSDGGFSGSETVEPQEKGFLSLVAS